MNYYLLAFKSYAIFSGRSRRAEFWYFVLVNLLVSIGFTIIDFAFGLTIISEDNGLTSFIYTLIAFLPSLAVSVRRLHDTGRSGWWILIAFTIIGAFFLIYWYALDSEAGDNEFGPNPKQIIV